MLEKINVKKYWNAVCYNNGTVVNFPEGGEKNQKKHCSSGKVISINQPTGRALSERVIRPSQSPVSPEAPVRAALGSSRLRLGLVVFLFLFLNTHSNICSDPSASLSCFSSVLFGPLGFRYVLLSLLLPFLLAIPGFDHLGKFPGKQRAGDEKWSQGQDDGCEEAVGVFGCPVHHVLRPCFNVNHHLLSAHQTKCSKMTTNKKKCISHAAVQKKSLFSLNHWFDELKV